MAEDAHYRRLESEFYGSVYFRALDDAAFFAANSRVTDVLVLTVSFTVHFTAPISAGELIALGRVVHEAGRLLVAESELRDSAGRLLAKGSGTFPRRDRLSLGNAARLLGVDHERGSIRAGLAADLIAVPDNPLSGPLRLTRFTLRAAASLPMWEWGCQRPERCHQPM